LDSSAWTNDAGAADKVATAVLEWATENDATNYCHIFQPLGASGFRPGLAGMVQNAFFKFDGAGRPAWDFKGKDLLMGETDGSSYPNGGLRATHRAGGYVGIDPTSPIFLRGDTIFVPACLVSFSGDALDEKTPLLRSADALNREGTRLLKLLGYDVSGVHSNIGLEQEFFLVPRDAYTKRIDLQLCLKSAHRSVKKRQIQKTRVCMQAGEQSWARTHRAARSFATTTWHHPLKARRRSPASRSSKLSASVSAFRSGRGTERSRQINSRLRRSTEALQPRSTRT